MTPGGQKKKPLSEHENKKEMTLDLSILQLLSQGSFLFILDI